MYLQLILFVLVQSVGGISGALLAPQSLQIRGALAGMLVAGLLWVLLDFLRGLRLLSWVRKGRMNDVPIKRGLLGELANRVRRLIRDRDAQINESDRRLQDFLAALQASPSGVVLLDPEGRIEWFNQTAASHFGFEFPRDLLQQFGNLVRDPAYVAYAGVGDFSGDVLMPGRRNTSSHPVRLSVQLHPYGLGRRLLLSRDITVLEQAEAQRRDFVANVSHEIRTPLTVLSGFIETLQTLPLEAAERSRYLGLMAQQADRMQTLVNDLLTLSRLDGSPVPGAADWVPMPALMKQLENEAKQLSELLNPPIMGAVQLVSFEEVPPSELAGSGNELHSAMSNLLSNAIRYTPSGGQIKCAWRLLDDGRGEFFVQDSGPGIAPEHIPRLTERFYRVDRSRSRDTGGTGLGLAIVKHVAQRHDAKLSIESAPGKGSRFSLFFPAGRVRSR